MALVGVLNWGVQLLNHSSLEQNLTGQNPSGIYHGLQSSNQLSSLMSYELKGSSTQEICHQAGMKVGLLQVV